METNGKYTRTASYASTIPEAEEQRPLTWPMRENFSGMPPNTPEERLHMKTISQDSNLAKKQTNVNVVYVSCDNGSTNHQHRVTWCDSTRSQRPEIKILLIALIFVFLLLTVIFSSIIFELAKKRAPKIDRMEVTTPKHDHNLNFATSPITIALSTNSSSSDYVRAISSSTTEASTKQGTITLTSPIPPSATTTTTSELSSSSFITPTISTTQQSTPAMETHAPVMTSTTFSKTEITHPKAQTTETTTKYLPTAIIRDYGQFTTIVERTPDNFPIFYISGPFTFAEANAACEREGAILALKQDLKKAWNEGYNRCTLGWLRDMHVAMIMQEAYASVDCDKGGVGVLYKPAREPNDKYSGTYCAKEDAENVDIQSLKIGSNPNNSVNWWMTVDPADAFNLRHTLMSVMSSDSGEATYPLLRSLKAVYTCCNAFNISYDVEEKETLIATKFSASYLREVFNFYRREMAPARIFTHVTTSYASMMIHGAATSNRSAIISSLIAKAKDAGLDGLIMDYEPAENYTREHAETYRVFLDDFATAMENNNMTLGAVISSWGILKYYDVYAKSKVEFMGSMGSTYYGHNLEKNQDNVNRMLESIEADRLEIGLGLMHEPGTVRKPKRNYRWSEETIRKFLSWSKESGITRFHIYPGQWRAHKASEKYFLNALADF